MLVFIENFPSDIHLLFLCYFYSSVPRIFGGFYRLYVGPVALNLEHSEMIDEEKFLRIRALLD